MAKELLKDLTIEEFDNLFLNYNKVLVKNKVGFNSAKVYSVGNGTSYFERYEYEDFYKTKDALESDLDKYNNTESNVETAVSSTNNDLIDDTLKLYTVEEVMGILHIGVNQVYALINSKKLKAIKPGHKWLVSKRAIYEYIVNEENNNIC